MDKRAYIEAIANIRTKALKEIPSISIVNNNTFSYRLIIIELLKNGYPERDVIDAIKKNYQSENATLKKSELLNIVAMVASSNFGEKDAVNLYKNEDNDLLKAYWLIGISQKNEAHEINTALKYDLYI